MKIAFEVDARLVVVASLVGFAGVFALHAAYPSLFNFWPASSQDLAAWVQAVGTLIALGIAIWAPLYIQQREMQQARKLLFAEADISIQFHRELFETNEQLLNVTIAHLPGGRCENHPDIRDEILNSIASLRSLDFEQVRVIGLHDQKLAAQLAAFHCERQMLVDMLARNGEDALAKKYVMSTVIQRVKRLAEIVSNINKHKYGSSAQN